MRTETKNSSKVAMTATVMKIRSALNHSSKFINLPQFSEKWVYTIHYITHCLKSQYIYGKNGGFGKFLWKIKAGVAEFEGLC